MTANRGDRPLSADLTRPLVSALVRSADGAPVSAAEPCPRCGTPRIGQYLFCEACGWNFTAPRFIPSDPSPINALAEKRRARTEVRVAGRLVAAAARVLPVGDRTRYAEELRSELWEIARAGGGWRPQLGHAARLVIAAPRLRAGLRIPRRRGAVP